MPVVQNKKGHQPDFLSPLVAFGNLSEAASSGAGYGDQNNNAAYKDWGLSDEEGQRSGWICVQHRLCLVYGKRLGNARVDCH
jgi:hypothetical protein